MIVIIHDKVPTNASADVQDVLVQAGAVAQACERLGYAVAIVPLSLNCRGELERIGEKKTAVVFNLVESLGGRADLSHLAPLMLEEMGIPHTGSRAHAVRTTTDKIETKRLLETIGVPTPSWQRAEEALRCGLKVPCPCIVKPVAEDGSCGIDDACVCATPRQVMEKIASLNPGIRDGYFIERFIEGREFNIGLLAGVDGVEVLPAAEMLFVDFPPDKPRILTYASKWNSDGFDYIHTVRSFETPRQNRPLLDMLGELSLRCWHTLDLSGYVRVDFRVDVHEKPWVLEVNANPCISPDSGFTAAAERAGYSYANMVRRIIDDALRRRSGT